VVQSELDSLNNPDSQRTSLIAFAGIIILLYILTRSVKSTVLPLLTVVLSIIWILGSTGFFRVPFNNITQSVLTMIIGIGIDFGLQVVNRFNQEVERNDKKTAMKETLANILTPMIITVLAALIGFRAMGLGQLKVMADLGVLMGIGITASMIISVSFIAALTVLTYREKKKE
jgi:predicted RND superfamily exporter protein